ncbi:MAG: cysteine--tRNA ligase [Myxococcota bacterium]
MTTSIPTPALPFRLFNTLHRKLETLHPIEPNHVRMYTCGPTVHGEAHIGNFRTFLFEDLLRRALRLYGYQVTQVMNLTDVDDKTIRKSRASGMALADYTARYKRTFFADRDALRIQPAEHYPEATAYIDAMVAMIQTLTDRGHTYRSEGSTYFRLSSYPDYGRLSGTVCHHQASNAPRQSRIDHDEYGKDDVRDFALWKAWTEADGEVYWDTPLGRGRPGWHIECSAMGRALLGDHFDIHTGGVDNCFPHHENEIAQSRAATGKDFVNIWLHSEHLMIDGRKMSKSLGNISTLRELLAHGWDPVTVRYALLSAHYRTSMNLTEDLLHASTQAIERLRELRRRLRALSPTAEPPPHPTAATEGLEQARRQVRQALFTDLNLPEALGHLFVFVRQVHGWLDRGQLPPTHAQPIVAWLENEVDAVLDVLNDGSPPREECEADVARLAAQRDTARAQRDWALADALRDAIIDLGYAVQDTPQGTVWSRKLTRG